MTTLATTRPAPSSQCSRPPTSTAVTATPQPNTAIRPAFWLTTALSTPAATEAPAESRSSSPLHHRGIVYNHSRPYHPQTCGKVERFHQTQKKWLATQPRADTVAQLQDQLDAFRSYYNTQRPHRALGRRTPHEAYHARSKATASGIPLVGGHYRVRHDKIDSNGKLTLRHNSRLHHIGMGRRHAGTPVLILVHDRHVRIITTSGRPLRDFQLDPTRDYQPQSKTPPANR